MTQWASFTLVSVLLTVSLLVLAGRSQQLLNAGDGSGPTDGTDKPVASTDDRPSSPEPNIELTPKLLLANVLTTQGGVVLILVVSAWYFSIPADAFGVTAAPSNTGLQAVALGLAFGFGLWISNELATALADTVGASYDESLRELLSPDSSGGWLLLFGVVLPIIAIAEELLFRAALIGVPVAGFGVSPWPLVAVSSLAFAMGHGAQGRVGIVVTGVLGLVLATGYILSGSLLVVVVAHYLINTVEFFVHEYLGVKPPFSAADSR